MPIDFPSSPTPVNGDQYTYAGVLYIYDGLIWQPQGKVPVANLITDSTTARNIASTDAGAYLRFTNTSAKTVTFRPNATHALAADTEYHLRNAAASGNLTVTAGSGVTINAPVGGTLIVPPSGTVTVKRVAVDVFDLFGATT